MRTFALALALLGLTAAFAPAQAQTGFMPYVGYNLEDEEFLVGVGARFGVNLALPVAVIAQPAVEYEFVEGGDLIQVDANAVAEFTGSRSFAPYAGAGLGITIANPEIGDGSTELGLNVLGGLLFNPTGFGQPFVQGRYATRGEFQDAFTVQGGVILAL